MPPSFPSFTRITVQMQLHLHKFKPSCFPLFTFKTKAAVMSSSGWFCSKCTHLNSSTQKATCKICLSPSPPAASSSSRWSCPACTFFNSSAISFCLMCGSKAPASFSEPKPHIPTDPPADASALSRPLRPCGSKRQAAAEGDGAELSKSEKLRKKEVEIEETDAPAAAFAGHSDSSSDHEMFKILSYNVWFREDLEVHKRMKALGDLIQLHLPDVICFQEVTPIIYEIFQNSKWWKRYKCSVSQETAIMRPYFCMQMSKLPVKAFRCKPFANSIMGRELCIAEIDVGVDKKLVVATSHLESPCPAPPRWDQMYSKERVAQAKESVELLKDFPNVIFAGDMNWDDKLDGAFPLDDGWVDAWTELRSGEKGWTYDTKSNQMLTGNRTLQKRLDRFVCKLKDFKVGRIEMIGMEAIPGISYCKEKKVRKEVKQLVLPVLPSDHYGLLLMIHAL